ncbi:formin-like protein 17 [Ipomoea triloba]|uniref:formin-like protein 17 n=1 Tax=Ipomoea triloba TaxID=35885 RepID=UPI00125E3721|nr:formin-like protein 17 [Ipomoea triloba]
MKGKALFSRAISCINSQTKKLKPLHWLKISRAVQGSLWAETQKSETAKAPELDISELESLFSAAVPNSDKASSGRKGNSRTSLGAKAEKVQLVIYVPFGCIFTNALFPYDF